MWNNTNKLYFMKFNVIFIVLLGIEDENMLKIFV